MISRANFATEKTLGASSESGWSRDSRFAAHFTTGAGGAGQRGTVLTGMTGDSRIIRAIQDAAAFHDGQCRNHKNDPHMFHIIRVTGRVMTLKDTVVSDVTGTAWHDVGEDCCKDAQAQRAIYTLHEERYGPESLAIMRGLTKVSIFSNASKAERLAMDLRFMQSQPFKVKRIKCLDRIDNLSETLTDLMSGRGASARHALGYCEESDSLAEVLAGIEPELMSELQAVVKEVRRVATKILNSV